MLMSHPVVVFPYVTINQQDSKIAFKLYSLHVGYQVSRRNVLAGPALYILDWNFNSPIFSQYNLTPQILLQTYMDSYKAFIEQLSNLLVPYILSSRIRNVSLVYALLNDNLQGFATTDKSKQSSKHYSVAKDLLLIISDIYSRVQKLEFPTPNTLYTINLTNTNRPLYQIELIHNPISNIQLGRLLNLVENLDKQDTAINTGIHLLTVQQTETLPVLIHKYSVYNRVSGWETKLIPISPMHTYDLNVLSVLDERFLAELSSHIKLFIEIEPDEFRKYAEEILGVENKAYISVSSTSSSKATSTETLINKVANQANIVSSSDTQIRVMNVKTWQDRNKLVIEYIVRIETNINIAQTDVATKESEKSEKSEEKESTATETESSNVQKRNSESEISIDESKKSETLDTRLADEAGKENKDNLDFDSLFS